MRPPSTRTDADADFAGSFFLLQNEGYLIRGSLTTGLTALRRANLAERGQYYTALFQLSIGLERLLKVILIIRHMADHSLATPSSERIRAFGHDLGRLLAEVGRLAPRNQIPAFERLTRDSVECDLLTLLNRFARSARYHNLDSLAAGETAVDPLGEWAGIITRILCEDIRPRQARAAMERAKIKAAHIRNSAFVLAHDLERHSMSLDELALVPSLYASASRFSVAHVFNIVRPLAEVVDHVTSDAHRVHQDLGVQQLHVPYMSEFLEFAWASRATVLRRRKWQ
jgi:hypothetical protein